MAYIKCPFCNSKNTKITDSHILNVTSDKSCASYMQERARIHNLIIEKVTKFQLLQQKKEELEENQKKIGKQFEESESELEKLKKERHNLDFMIAHIKDGDKLLEEKRLIIKKQKKQLSDLKSIKIKIEDIDVVKNLLYKCKLTYNTITRK